MSTAFQLLLHYLTQLASLFWSPLNRLFLMENQPPNSPTFDAQADGAGNCSPNLPQDSEAAALNFDDIENTEPLYNHQMILDGTAKIEHDIIANYPLVSETIIVDALHDDYAEEDDIYQQKVEDLKTNYSFIRKTRPDGNCFYRAFIFSYFESLFNDEDEQKRFSEICKETRRGIEEVLGFPDFTIDEFYEYFRDITTGILEKRITTATELLNELDQPAVYDNIVVYLRLMTSYYLQKESDFFTNFIEGSGSIGDFCKREVEPMYKESDHIHIIALSSVFNVTVRVVYMDRGAGGKVNEHDFNPLHAEGPPAEPRIHMLYRPGHYDVLYVRSKAGQGFESLSPGAVLAAADAGSQSPAAHQNGCSSSSPLSPASVPAAAASSPAPHQQLSATCPSPAHPGHNSEPDSSSNGQADGELAVVGSPKPVASPLPPPTSSDANSTQPDL